MTSSDPQVSDATNDEAFVPVFSSSNHDAEMEAMTVNSILEASGIPTVLVAPHMIPSLEFQVQVPEHLAGQAQQILDDARLAGPRAAEEAEAESERMTL